MPFGMMNGLAPRNCMLRGGYDSHREGAISVENMCLTSLVPLIIVNWLGSCSGTRQGQTLDCKHWTSLLSAVKWGCTSSFVDYIFFCNGPYSSTNSTMKDRLCLNLLIYRKVGQFNFLLSTGIILNDYFKTTCKLKWKRHSEIWWLMGRITYVPIGCVAQW